ncbi:SH3 domain-containing protein [uncultured Sphingomonas sp.]|uniref:SH3 domain-containing protein n=1 Tax=uncultured Sphingomonas sp. TaxID=158754 RepID=UPI0035CC6DD8
MRLDPTTHAVRGDLADARLADRVFAPHYAAPTLRIVVRSTPLLAARHGDGAPMTTLEVGAMFEVVEFAGGRAWGVAPGCGLVGYVDAQALGSA